MERRRRSASLGVGGFQAPGREEGRDGGGWNNRRWEAFACVLGVGGD